MKKFSISLLGVSVLLFLGMTIGVLASSQLEEIKAYLNKDLKVRVDGKVLQMNDANGNAVLPISYEGSTYLPVRAISDALGVAVHYDGDAYEVVLGERLDGIAIKHEKFNDVLYSKEPSERRFGDKDYEEVLYSRPGGGHGYTALTPDKKYQTLYLQIAALDEDIEHIEIKDHQANALLKRVENISTEDGMITIEVDVAGVETVTINVKKKRAGGWVIPLTTSYYK